MKKFLAIALIAICGVQDVCGMRKLKMVAAIMFNYTVGAQQFLFTSTNTLLSYKAGEQDGSQEFMPNHRKHLGAGTMALFADFFITKGMKGVPYLPGSYIAIQSAVYLYGRNQGKKKLQALEHNVKK